MKKILIFLFLISSLVKAQDILLNPYAFAPLDPAMALNPVQYSNANSITGSDGSSQSTFDDLSGNGYHWQTLNTSPTLRHRGGGKQEILFNGTNQSLRMSANHSALDFDPDSSNYTIIIHLGNEAMDNFSGIIIQKANFGSSDERQFSFLTNSSGTNFTFTAGDTGQNLSSWRTGIADDFIVIRRNGGSAEIWRNNTLEHSITAGSRMVSNFWTIASRSFGGFSNAQDMAVQKTIYYNYALTTDNLTTLYNERDNF